jgi:inorganic triphosphatase YgiF
MATEIELKLSFEPRKLDAVLAHPRLAGVVAGAREHLVATYYDTPDLRLRAEGIGLRVRREGERWIQTIKTADSGRSGLHQREEIESEVESERLDRTKLPVQGPLAELFADAELRHALEPVVITDISREVRYLTGPGKSRIEVAVDRGRIRAGKRSRGIAELELELLSGEPAVLFELALSLAEVAPLRLQPLNKAEQGYTLLQEATPEPRLASLPGLSDEMTSEAAFQAIMYRCVDHFRGNEAAVLARDVEGVHQYRVGLRRMRSCMTVFRPLVPKSAVAMLKDDIRWVNEVTGPVRDWDVFIEGLEPLHARFSEHPGLIAFLRQAHEIRDRHDKLLRSRLRSARYAHFMLALEAWLATMGWRKTMDAAAIETVEQPIRGFALRVLSKSYRRMRREGRDFDHLPTEIKHDLRIRAKQLRYALQFFTSLYGKDHCRPMLKTLGALQDNLGVLNDIVVADRLLDEAGLQSTDSARALIDGWFAARLEMQEGYAGEAWQAFADAPRPWKE